MTPGAQPISFTFFDQLRRGPLHSAIIQTRKCRSQSTGASHCLRQQCKLHNCTAWPCCSQSCGTRDTMADLRVWGSPKVLVLCDGYGGRMMGVFK